MSKSKQTNFIKKNSKSISRNTKTTKEIKFITNVRTKSVLSKGPKSNLQMTCDKFAYDLSPGELIFSQQKKHAMKSVPHEERKLLDEGQRKAYLMQRYIHAPDDKYYYPEATSWRIGWQHKNS